MSLDRRVRYTKKVIKDSFLKLLYEHSLNEVTIKAICLEADINRATFYRHYRDINDLFKEIESELVKEASFDVAKDLIDIKMLTIVFNNQGFYREFFRTNLISSVFKKSNQYLYEAELAKAKQSEDFITKKFKYAFDYFVYGIEGLLKDWVENGCIEPPEAFSEILEEVTSL